VIETIGELAGPTLPENLRVASLEEAASFVTDTRHYREFDLTRPDFSIIIGCIDPRTELRKPGKRIKTVIQTPGGGAGEADDRAIAETAVMGSVVTPSQALILEKHLRGTTVLGGHTGCKYIAANNAVKAEQIDPSQQTLDNVERTLFRYNRRQRVMPLLPRIIEAATAVDVLPTDFHVQLDEYSPKHNNVTHVHGENEAQIYVVNHSTKVGLDRNAKAKLLLEEGVDIQFYHESRGAAIADLITTYDAGEGIVSALGANLSQKKIQKALDYRVGAWALRSCASETVLTSLRPTARYDVVHPSSGLEINLVKEIQ
jgi:hypothetical protein